MTLTELRDEVYNLTNRTDLISETTTAIKAATLKLHGLDYYVRDISEATLNFPSSDNIFTFDYKTTYPRWRAFKYLRLYDIVTSTPGRFVRRIPVELVLDEWGQHKEDVCYAAADVLQIRLATVEANFLMGFYEWPRISPDIDYSSWIADDVPYAIVHEAASQVFKTIGYDEQYQRFQKLNEEHLAIVRNSGILGEGY